MKAELIFTAGDCKPESVEGKNAVVIDVLRATSVIVTALDNGASGVAAFKTVGEALRYAEESRETRLLCGERNAMPIDGFDLGNSPLEFDSQTVAGKEVVLTTTNGTQAIENAKAARRLYVMCFLNVFAAAEKLALDGADTVFVCAGTGGRFSLDDCVCAGLCIDTLSRLTSVSMDDAAFFACNYWRMSGGDVNHLLKHATHYNILLGKGFGRDLEYCAGTGTIGIVPYYKDSKIVCNEGED